MKAAKVRKPLLYASPEAINEAAVARAAVGRLPVSSGTFSSSSSSSSSGSSFTSSSSASSSSSVGLIGGLIGRSKAYSPFKYLGRVPGKVTSSCGCGKTSESLQVHDLLSSNVEGKVVPRYILIRLFYIPTTFYFTWIEHSFRFVFQQFFTDR